MANLALKNWIEANPTLTKVEKLSPRYEYDLRRWVHKKFREKLKADALSRGDNETDAQKQANDLPLSMGSFKVATKDSIFVTLVVDGECVNFQLDNSKLLDVLNACKT